MFVIIADQISSRTDRDRAADLIALLTTQFGSAFVLPPDQTAGDEIQVMTTQAAVALDAVLAVHRTGHWSIGLGLGAVRTPYPAATRQASGPAFIAARAAVTRAKKAEARFALDAATQPLDDPDTADGTESAAGLDAAETEALLVLLLLLRQRRSAPGWEAIDLLQSGLSQLEVAERLDVSTAAVSQRIKAASWRAENAARPALVKLLGDLDRALTETEPAA